MITISSIIYGVLDNFFYCEGESSSSKTEEKVDLLSRSSFTCSTNRIERPLCEPTSLLALSRKECRELLDALKEKLSILEKSFNDRASSWKMNKQNIEGGMREYCKQMATKEERTECLDGSLGKWVENFIGLTKQVATEWERITEQKPHLMRDTKTREALEKLIKRACIYYWGIIYLPQFVEDPDLFTPCFDSTFLDAMQWVGKIIEDEIGGILQIPALERFLTRFRDSDADLQVISIGCAAQKKQQLLPSLEAFIAKYPQKKLEIFLFDDFSNDPALVVRDKSNWKQIDRGQWKHLIYQNLTVHLANPLFPLDEGRLHDIFFSPFKKIVQQKLEEGKRVVISQHTGSSMISGSFFSCFCPEMATRGKLFLLGQSGFPPLLYVSDTSEWVRETDLWICERLFNPSSECGKWIYPSTNRVEELVKELLLLAKKIGDEKKQQTKTEQKEHLDPMRNFCEMFSSEKKIRKQIGETLSRVRAGMSMFLPTVDCWIEDEKKILC